jgi:energy-coupling factor transporter ATP-binding protein EcfA2
MAITRFEFEDRDHGWRVHPFELSDFNLLVGLSGAGKTRILQALELVSKCASGGMRGLTDDAWQLELMTPDGVQWQWSAEVQTQPSRFVSEEISRDHSVILERTSKGIQFMDRPLPELKDGESLISMFRKADEVRPLFEALARVHLSSADDREHFQFDVNVLEAIEGECASLEALRNAHHPLPLRAYILQTKFPNAFEALVEAFCDIFPTVDRVEGAQGPRDEDLETLLVFNLFEDGVAKPVPSLRWSSGMLRTWLHILELGLYPAGSVILIDEYENGLGVNCLPALTRLIRERAGELQFIITSHHPYVINHVPVADWQIVQRKGSEVRLKPASSMPRLTGLSKQKAFTLLMSSREFLTESIQ